MVGTFATLVVRWSEGYPGCDIIFGGQRVCGVIRDEEFTLGPR